jgi:hypothetical protein
MAGFEFSTKEKRLSYHCLLLSGVCILSTFLSIQEPTAKQLNLIVESAGCGCFKALPDGIKSSNYRLPLQSAWLFLSHKNQTCKIPEPQNLLLIFISCFLHRPYVKWLYLPAAGRLLN